MTIKRLILMVLTLVAIAIAGFSLFNSWQEPQFQSRLELYQTNITLQAAQWEPPKDDSGNLKPVRAAILGQKPLEAATKQYQDVREAAETNLEKTKNQLAKLEPILKPDPEFPTPSNASRELEQKQLQQSQNQQQKFIAELDLRLGILQAQQQKSQTAIKTWSQLPESNIDLKLKETAAVLTGLWSDPPRLLPNAQELIQENLEGWFSSTALTQLYQLQQRQEALSTLEVAKQASAYQALVKLAIIATIPTLTALIGMGLLIFLIGQRLIKGKAALLAQNGDRLWTTPWDVETILQVFVVGFFLLGQLVVPILLSLLPISRPVDNVKIQAFYVLVTYLLLSSGGLSVLYFSLKPFLPLESDWFRLDVLDKWFLWGLGGYCVAFPIVVVVSLINQQLWQGQGGSNPLLQLALESQDTTALSIFFFTAAIAAPLFEEVLFRGFLLPSLTRYFSVWGAIFVSALLFAIAHLSLSEILPLSALGVVLGVVYTRSRNLLAPMLLHSLWNSGTLLSLFLLGSNK